MAVSQEYIEQVISRNDIVEVISSNVQLNRKGRIYNGLCPFHNEKSPSFTVYPETQSFYCFGCGVGGTVLTYVSKYNNLEFLEAVKSLASRANMPLPDEDDKVGELRNKILQINKETARFYYNNLNTEKGVVARKYWRNRGLEDSTITKYGLGYSLDSFGELTNHLTKKGFTKKELLASGVVKLNKNGGMYDAFRNRVMIPIFDLRGNVIAFGGRSLGDEKPKYINSPETLVYKKSKTLFALNIAKKNVSRRYILCEGYLDVISMHQAGFETAVAGCGTALTNEQVKIISNYADEVVLCYDSDEAGQKAAKKAVSLFNNTNVKVSIIKLDGAKDPDEYIKKYGREKFDRELNGANNIIEYEMQNLKSKYNLTTPDGRLEYTENALKILASKITPTQRDVYAGRLSQELGIEKKAILEQLNYNIKMNNRIKKQRIQKELQSTNSQADIRMVQGAKNNTKLGAEQLLIGAILKDEKNYNIVKGNLTKEDFTNNDMALIFNAIENNIKEGKSIDLAYLSGELSEQLMQSIYRIMAINYDVSYEKQDVLLHINNIKKNHSVAKNVKGKSAKEIMDDLKNRGIIK